MTVDDIKLLFEYNDWATERVFDSAGQVAPEQLMAPSDFGWGSCLGTLLHIVEAQFAWRKMLTEGAFTEFLALADFPDLAAVRARWQREKRAWRDYLRGLDDEGLDATFEYATEFGQRRRVVWHCLLHVVNHGSQHRSECAAMLTELGHSPGNLDLGVFLELW